MTAPTRRQVMAGSLAALGAAGAPAIAVAADPDERLRNAVQELQDAIQSRWPGGEVRSWDQLNDTGGHVNPGIILVASERRSRPPATPCHCGGCWCCASGSSSTSGAT